MSLISRGELFHDCFEPIDYLGGEIRHFTCTVPGYTSISNAAQYYGDHWEIGRHGGTKSPEYIAIVGENQTLVSYDTFKDKQYVIKTSKDDFIFAISDGHNYGWIHVKEADGKLVHVESAFETDDFICVPLPGPRLTEGGTFDLGKRIWTYEPTVDGFARITDVTPRDGELVFPSECAGVRVDEIKIAPKFGGETCYSIIIPEGVTKLGQSTFYSTWAKKVSLPTTLNIIEGYAFFGTELDEVVIPRGVSKIEIAAFGSANVKCFKVDADNPWYTALEGSLYQKEPLALICSKLGEEIRIPYGVKGIEYQAFYYVDTCRLSIPCTVETLDPWAFSGVPTLSMVEFRDGVLTCDLRALNKCHTKIDATTHQAVSVPIPVIRIPWSVTAIESDMSVLKGVKYVLCDDIERTRKMTEAAGLDTANIVFGECHSRGEEFTGIQEWASKITGFNDKYCNDVQSAIILPTGKKNARGEEMYVYEDYIAGTDPMNPDDQFKVNVEIVDGKPVITYEPDLGDARKYTTLGSNDLHAWTPVDENAADYKFFKVEVNLTR